MPFCLWCVCGAATLISVIYFHMTFLFACIRAQLPNAPLEAASSVCDLLRLREKLLLQVLEPGRRAQTHIRHLEERVQLIHTPGLNGRPELCGNLNDERPERIHQPVAIRCNWSQSVAISVNQM